MPRWSRLNKLKHTLHQDVSITYSILNEMFHIDPEYTVVLISSLQH